MNKLKLLFFIFPFFSLAQNQVGQTLFGENVTFPNGSTYKNHFGTDIKYNEDGTRMIIGGHLYRNNRGRVRVFDLIDGDWTQIGQGIDGISSNTNNAGIGFGWSVAISADGNIIAASAPGYNALDAGYVKIYELQSNIWTETQSFSVGFFTSFGYQISLSSDGNRIAISTPKKWANGQISGQVKVYENQSGIWTQIGQDLNGDIYSEFGTSLDLSADGNTMIIGSSRDSNSSIDNTVAKIYEFQTNSWIEIFEFSAELNEKAVGSYVDLNANGNICTVKSLYLDASDYKEQIKVYQNINGIWTQIGNNIRNSNINLFAFKNKISNDGNVLVIGSPFSGTNGDDSGEASIYQNQFGIWTPILNSFFGHSDDFLGYTVALLNDGTNFAISATRENYNGELHNGTVRAYDIASYLELLDDIQGNINGINVTAEQLNNINGVSGAINNVDYTTALQNGVYVNPNNPTPEEIQVIIDTVNDSLSLVENLISKFNLYPNPTKDQFTIELSDNIQLEKVNIYNNLGQFIYASEKSIINTSKLSSGIYYVEIETNKGKSTKKLIIE
jgi:hypothetical protein